MLIQQTNYKKWANSLRKKMPPMFKGEIASFLLKDLKLHSYVPLKDRDIF